MSLAFPLIAQITDHLWLGNLAAAEDAAMLQDRGIEAMVNVCRTTVPPLDFIESFACPLRDNEQNLPLTLLAATLLVDEALARYDQVFLHCHHGGSRSVAVAMFWLRRHGLSPDFPEARAYIQERYPLRLSSRQPRPGLMELMVEAWPLSCLLES